MASHSVPEVLGGESVLGRRMRKGGALAELVREGLPVQSLFLLAERLNLRQGGNLREDRHSAAHADAAAGAALALDGCGVGSRGEAGAGLLHRSGNAGR